MKKAAEMIGSILLLIAFWTFRLVWRIIKIAVFLAILWGAIESLSNTSVPVIGDIVSLTKTANLSFFGVAFLSWIAENWMAFAILLIFLNSLFSRRALEELHETSSYTRIFIGTVMSYFGVETETHDMKKMRKTGGVWAVMKEALAEGVAARTFGIELPDSLLSAKAVRYGNEVHLSDDVKKAVGGDTDKQGKG